MLNDQVKKGGVMASSYVGGLSGAFIPVSEDQRMIDAVNAGALTLEKLEAAGMKQNKEWKMKIIGITGGVGSGKSEILNILENEYGARIIIADLVAHKLMEPDGISYKGIVKAFGKGIVKADGFIDREVLGSIVFCSERKLKILNEITHKNVDAEIMRQIEEIRKEDPNALVVCEAALLVGAQYESLFVSSGIFIRKKKFASGG